MREFVRRGDVSVVWALAHTRSCLAHTHSRGLKPTLRTGDV